MDVKFKVAITVLGIFIINKFLNRNPMHNLTGVGVFICILAAIMLFGEVMLEVFLSFSNI